MTSLSETQYAIVVVAGALSGALSLTGSSLIVASIIKRRKLHDTLHQLLFGLSLADMLSSILSICTSFVVPRSGEMGGVIIDSALAPYAAGNYATCAMWAFLYYFAGMVTCIYNFLLSLHFWRCVRSPQKRSAEGRQRWSQFAQHSVALLLPLALTILPVTVKVPEHGPFVFNKYPMVCYMNLEGWGPLRLRAFLTTLMALLSTGFTMALLRLVKASFQRTHRYAGSGGDNQDLSREQKLAKQALWYFLAYLNSFAPVLLVLVYKNVVDVEGTKVSAGSYAVILIMWFFGPLQGTLNFAVFVRPRYQAWNDLLHKKIQQKSLEGMEPIGRCGDTFFKLMYSALFEEMPAAIPIERRETILRKALKLVPDDSALTFRWGAATESSATTNSQTWHHLSAQASLWFNDGSRSQPLPFSTRAEHSSPKTATSVRAATACMLESVPSVKEGSTHDSGSHSNDNQCQDDLGNGILQIVDLKGSLIFKEDDEDSVLTIDSTSICVVCGVKHTDREGCDVDNLEGLAFSEICSPIEFPIKGSSPKEEECLNEADAEGDKSEYPKDAFPEPRELDDDICPMPPPCEDIGDDVESQWKKDDGVDKERGGIVAEMSISHPTLVSDGIARVA